MMSKTNIMNSKIRVDYDFNNQDPFIQLTVEDGDLNDKALLRFIQEVMSRGVELIMSDDNPGNPKSIPMLRPMKAQKQEPIIVASFEQICIESLPPEHLQALENILCELRKNRRALSVS